MAHAKSQAQTLQPSEYKPFDPIAFSHAMVEAYKEAQPVFQKFWEKSYHDLEEKNFDPLNVTDAYLEFMENVMADPQRFWDLQAEYYDQWLHLWQESLLKFMGEKSHPVAVPDKGDRRFRAEEWEESAIFDFIKQSYLMTSKWMERVVREDEALSKDKKEKLAFCTRLFADALSPTNFLPTNPEVLKETIQSGGENLIKGLKNLIKDLERGGGELKISTTQYNAFELGKNIAVTPGKVVYQNDLMQLIQYDAQTDDVYKRPLLIVPPWINKYYILDLKKGNSFIEWAVQQGHTAFIISWVNPDTKLAKKKFEDYMREGVLESLTQIEKLTGERCCNAVGYCLGGTLLAITLAYLKQHNEDDKIASVTYLTTMLDFEQAGDMKMFLDDEQLEFLEKHMNQTGILQAEQLQKTFSLLRANDLIWSFVVNNYLMGREPFPFDLLYWNDDSTNMPAAMHSFYLRNMYRNNLLVKPGGIKMFDTPIDITAIKTPSYFLSTREDHIAPWPATYSSAQMLSGPVKFVLAASGHIAGVVNSPHKNKYCYWTSAKTPKSNESWLKEAKEYKGSWWPNWQKWIKTYTGGKTEPRKIADFIEHAPGSYVKIKSNDLGAQAIKLSC